MEKRRDLGAVAWAGSGKPDPTEWRCPGTCPDAGPGSPTGGEKLRSARGECRCGSCSYRDGGRQPAAPPVTRCFCFPPPAACWGRSSARRPSPNTRFAGSFARTRLVSRFPSQRGRNKRELPSARGGLAFSGRVVATGSEAERLLGGVEPHTRASCSLPSQSSREVRDALEKQRRTRVLLRRARSRALSVRGSDFPRLETAGRIVAVIFNVYLFCFPYCTRHIQDWAEAMAAGLGAVLGFRRGMPAQTPLVFCS